VNIKPKFDPYEKTDTKIEMSKADKESLTKHALGNANDIKVVDLDYANAANDPHTEFRIFGPKKSKQLTEPNTMNLTYQRSPHDTSLHGRSLPEQRRNEC
jgi:hypothetical protein